MGFITDFFRAYVDAMEDAGFLEGCFVFVLFVFSILTVFSLLFATVVLLAVALCHWWSSAGAGAATVAPAALEEPDAAEERTVEELAAVEEVVDLPAGGEQAARAVCRRRAARDSALSEPGSSSGGIGEFERD